MISRIFQRSVICLVSCIVLLVAQGTTAAQLSAKISIDSLDKLSSKASETVDVTLNDRLLQLASKFLSSDKSSDEARIKDIVSKLKGVYVKSFEFDKAGQYSPDDVEPILAQLRTPGWSRIVGVTNKKSGEDIQVYISSQGSDVLGLAVIAAEPTSLTVVNIVGPVDIEKLSELEGNFGIPKLHIDPKASKK